jgi:hypothetical protein
VLLAREDCLGGSVKADEVIVWDHRGFSVVRSVTFDCSALATAWQSGQLEMIPETTLSAGEYARLQDALRGSPRVGAPTRSVGKARRPRAPKLPQSRGHLTLHRGGAS